MKYGEYNCWAKEIFHMNDAVNNDGFSLIEIISVIAIIAVLAAILVPIAGHARRTALKRRAMMEMQSIKVAGLQFYEDHGYMPWPPSTVQGQPSWVGDDVWTASPNGSDQQEVMLLLTGNNAIKKAYLQIPEKSRPIQQSSVFLDPWGQPYRIGLDRNLDGAVLPDATFCGHDQVMERILVYTPGDPDGGKLLKTF